MANKHYIYDMYLRVCMYIYNIAK